MPAETNRWKQAWENRPRWVDYAVTVVLQVGLTAFLLALSPVFPLSHYPIPYVLVTMFVAYVFGAGPAVLSGLIGWVAFDYYFVHPIHTLFWPIAVGKEAWAKQAAYVIGIAAVSIAMVQMRKSRRRIEQFADETTALNASLRAEADERERAAEQSQEYAHMLDLAHIIVRGVDGRILFWNRGAEALYGWSRDEAVGKTTDELFHTVYPAPVEEIRTQVLREGEWQGELVHTRKDGSVITIASHWVVHRDENGDPKAFIEVNNDITQQKRAEEAVRDSEKKYRNLFTTMREAFMLTEVVLDDGGKPCDWRYLEANPAFGLNTGIDPDSIIGRTAREVLPEVESYWIETFGNVALTGQPARIEQYNKDLDRYFTASAFSPAPGQVAVLFSDVTDRMRAEEEIRKLNAELEQRVRARTAELEIANKELEAFSYSVSHDLRAPLRAIDGFSNAVLKHYLESLDARGQDYLQRIRAAAQRMAQLIDDILGLSRATRAEMHKQQVDLSATALDIFAELQKSEPERKAEITVEPGLVANADSHLIRIALDNLLGNAWKFTSQREVARIEFGHLEQDEILDRAGFQVPPDQGRVYYIRDNGAGFNPTYADKLFSPFQRLHAEEEFPGTGIGLALVQRILRRHGGRIWAESAVGQGAAFYFTLGEAEK